jgi:hypothetical protein
MDVTAVLIAGTGFLFAPAVIALAATLAAGGTGANVAEDESFTTIELKANSSGARARRRRFAGGRAGAPGSEHAGVGRDGHQRDNGSHDRPLPQHADGPGSPCMSSPVRA